MSSQEPSDHRTRVAADRRANTRNRLIQSAILVFSEKGVEASPIDDVIAAAGVSRGTYYNYFQSNRELLFAVNEQLREDFILVIKETVKDIPDPAQRIAISIGLLIQTGRENPLLANFVTQVGLKAAGPDQLIGKFLVDQIQQGIDQGRFLECPQNIAHDLLAGAMLFAFFRISQGGISDSHGPQVITTVLRGLGLNAQEAADLAAEPLPGIDIKEACSLIRSKAMVQMEVQEKLRSK